eukprot:4881083-Amphidinium_carterae.1
MVLVYVDDLFITGKKEVGEEFINNIRERDFNSSMCHHCHHQAALSSWARPSAWTTTTTTPS